MATIDVREAEAGPELDAACAEAMGMNWEWVWLTPGNKVVLNRKTGYQWFPSNYIGDAWVLVEYDAQEWDMSLEVAEEGQCQDAVWMRRQAPQDQYWAKGDTMALAITRTFLLAHGIETIEVDDG